MPLHQGTHVDHSVKELCLRLLCGILELLGGQHVPLRHGGHLDHSVNERPHCKPRCKTAVREEEHQTHVFELGPFLASSLQQQLSLPLVSLMSDACATGALLAGATVTGNLTALIWAWCSFSFHAKSAVHPANTAPLSKGTHLRLSSPSSLPQTAFTAAGALPLTSTRSRRSAAIPLRGMEHSMRTTRLHCTDLPASHLLLAASASLCSRSSWGNCHGHLTVRRMEALSQLTPMRSHWARARFAQRCVWRSKEMQTQSVFELVHPG